MWWKQNGRSREMTFDLTSGSRFWLVLLNYLYETFVEDLE